MRLGVFGGSFDPAHCGHLLLAECCSREAQLDRVDFVPTGRQPHKPSGAEASNADRVAMLRLAVEGKPHFSVSTLELDRSGPSYTVDTLVEVHEQQPAGELFFLMGADSLADFPNWRDPQRICELATLLVVRRAGAPEPDFEVLKPFVDATRLQAIRNMQVQMPETPISSSTIRKLIAQGGDWHDLVPSEVARYITSKRLYSH